MDSTNDKPITTEDLYGGSGQTNPIQNEPAMTYEETPIIKPVEEPFHRPEQPIVSDSVQKTPPQSFNGVKLIMLFVLLFLLGYLGSGFVKRFFTQKPSSIRALPTPTASPVFSNKLNESYVGATPSASQWKVYPVINGKTKKQIDLISISLPMDVLLPICDDSACSSQGTYLPGGTRLTIAPRGTGQVLPIFANQIITDAKGVAFTTKDITIGGKPAVEYSGSFAGSSVSGYPFTKMHGVMIEVTKGQLSLEINHFTPAGIIADFEEDDVLFSTILKTLSFSNSEKGFTP